MTEDLVLALAASPREWALRLHRHVADHGGARVRATVLHPDEALSEPYDVLVADDTTSFLTRHLVAQLHVQGRCVLGVYDADDPRGKSELIDLGVDAVVERSEPPAAFLAMLAALAPTSRTRKDTRRQDAPAAVMARRGHVVVVAAAGSGCGATEVAVALSAAAAARRERVILVDADEASPGVAARLGLPLYPNLRAAVDAVEHRSGELRAALLPVPAGRFCALPGFASPHEWSNVRARESAAVVRELAAMHDHVVVNVAARIDDLPTTAGVPRFAQTRALLGVADSLIAVTLATPLALVRLLDWIAHARPLAPDAPLHVVFNQCPASRFKRAELTAELQRAHPPASVSFLPLDLRVHAAAWAGVPVTTGRFRDAVDTLALRVLPPPRRARARRAAWRRKATA